MSLCLSHNVCMCHRPNQFLTRTSDAIDEKILECEAALAVQAELLGRGGGGGGNAKAADDVSAPTAAAAASPVATSAAVKTAGTVGGAAAANVAEVAGGAAKKGQEQQQAKADERVMVVGGALTLRLGEALARLLAMLAEGEGEGGPQRLFLIEETAAVEPVPPVPPVPVPPVPPVEHLRGYCDEAKQHLIDTSVSKWVGR